MHFSYKLGQILMKIEPARQHSFFISQTEFNPPDSVEFKHGGEQEATSLQFFI
jgi:hypothetical protein